VGLRLTLGYLTTIGVIVSTMCYLVNYLPSTIIKFKTPVKIWLDKSTKCSTLRTFGCLDYYYVYNSKFEPNILIECLWDTLTMKEAMELSELAIFCDKIS